MTAEFCPRSIYFILEGFFKMPYTLRHGNYGFTSPPKEVVLRIVAIVLRRFDPANLGSKGKHAATRPQRAPYYFKLNELLSSQDIWNQNSNSSDSAATEVNWI
jgi:hypothetical protein